MTDQAAVKAAIVANVGAVADIGQVHDFERYAKNQADMRALYESTIGGSQQIRGWHLVSLSGKRLNVNSDGEDDVQTLWELRGFMSLDDGTQSELAFDILVEAVIRQMRTDPWLGNISDTHDHESDRAGWQMVEKNKVMFAGILCHHVRLQMITWHTE